MTIIVVLVLSLHTETIFFSAFRMMRSCTCENSNATVFIFSKKYSCPHRVRQLGKHTGNSYCLQSVDTNYGKKQSSLFIY